MHEPRSRIANKAIRKTSRLRRMALLEKEAARRANLDAMNDEQLLQAGLKELFRFYAGHRKATFTIQHDSFSVRIG